MKSAKPCSIILPTYTPDDIVEDYLQKCLRHLKENTPKDLYDLIVVEQGDHGSACIRQADLYVYHNEPLGYARAVNIGLKLVETPFAVVLNNDVNVPPGWLETLMRDFESITDCGVMAPQDDPEMAKAITMDDHWYSLILVNPEEFGLFDETLPWRYQDQAKSIELRSRGLQICRTGNVRVEHVNSATFDKMGIDATPEREEMIRRFGHAEFHSWIAAMNAQMQSGGAREIE